LIQTASLIISNSNVCKQTNTRHQY